MAQKYIKQAQLPKPATDVRQACRTLSALKDESRIQGHSRSSLLVPAGIQNGVLS